MIAEAHAKWQAGVRHGRHHSRLSPGRLTCHRTNVHHLLGLNFSPLPLGGPTPPQRTPGSRGAGETEGKGGGNILTTLALELRVGVVLVLLKLAHVIVVGCRGGV